PSLSQETKRSENIKGRKVAILIEEGFHYESVRKLMHMLETHQAVGETVSLFQGTVKSSTGEELEIEKSHVTTTSVVYDAIFVVGGSGTEKMKQQGDVIHFINEAYKHCKPIAANGTAKDLLRAANLKGID